MKKILSAVLAAAMILSLAACGSKTGTTSSNTSTGSADPNAKPYEGQTLTVLYMSSVYADAARSMVDEFEEATGATVEVVD